MAKASISIKRLQIDKSNANTIAFLAISSVIVVFSLVASRALISQRSYQARVIDQKKKALEQLKTNNQAATQLVASFQTFQEPVDNIIGGTKTGTSDRDGDNAKIVLDALPSKYDFPALAASLDKILLDKGYRAESISGIDDELNQSTQTVKSSAPIEMPFQVGVSGSLDTIQGVLDVFQKSIRPIQLVKLELAGNNGNLNGKFTAKTYYQPEKSVTITTETVK